MNNTPPRMAANLNAELQSQDLSIFQGIKAVFHHNGKVDWPVVVLFLVINLLVVVNAIWHHPKIGYDVVDNLTYIQVLTHRLPGPADTGEFFSPPLPFFLPSLFDRICTSMDSGKLQPFDNFYISWNCRTPDGKFAQALNVLLSIGTTILLLVIAQQLKPDNRFFKLSILILLANLTVYYKTFAQVRPEPYVVFFTILSIFLILRLMKSSSFSWKLVIPTGISLGCLILSRQWGFFIYPAMGLFVVFVYFRNHQMGHLIAVQFILSGLLGLVIGAFFYLHLYRDYGSFSAFNIDHPIYPSMQQTYSFLRQTHLGNFELFKDPVREAFNGSILPILYSETWGDYWEYFSFIKPHSSFGANGYGNNGSFASYLGRVNLVSIPASLLLLAGIGVSFWKIVRFSGSATLEKDYLVFICLVMATMLLGFAWFIYSYMMASTLVLKTTYMLQTLVVLLFPVAEFLETIRIKWRLSYFIIIVLLVGAFIHNIPAMITHYNVFNFWTALP